MNTIVIDSGSTKADIAIIGKYNVDYYTQEGINTQVLKEIVLSNRLIDDVSKASVIHYYGAGCETEEDKAIITTIFKEINVGVEVFAASDMLGACRATAGINPGLVCILGTGSNSCLYDGYQIVDTIPQFGYILNDEGGGTYIGKLILNDYFNGDMPTTLSIPFQQHFNLEEEHILNGLYRSNNPSQFLASYVQFMSMVKGKWKKSVLLKAFNEFIEKRITKFTDYKEFDIFFVGGVAYNFHEHLRQAMDNHDLKIAGIEQRPIKKLVHYHEIIEQLSEDE